MCLSTSFYRNQLLSKRMSDLMPQTYAARPASTIGTLFRNEEWWRDQYYDIYHCGYDLRPRYHPHWEPSWRGSGKDFFAVEDGQPSIVSAIFSVLLMLTCYIIFSYGLQWMLHAAAMASPSCSRRFTPRKDHMS